jgi:hypothetical protein
MKANHIGYVDVSVLAGMRKIVCSSRDGVTQKTMKLVFDGSHALSHNVVHLAPIEIRTNNINGDRH